MFYSDSTAVISKLESVNINGGNITSSSTSSYGKAPTNRLSNGFSHHAIVNSNSPRQPAVQQTEDNVIRLPRGPDGSSGFLMKR